MSTAAVRCKSQPPSAADITVLRRLWQAAIAPGKKLPAYEEVVLGSLGRLADHLLLIEGTCHDEFRILRAGQTIRDWIGLDLRGLSLNDLPRACANGLTEVLCR